MPIEIKELHIRVTVSSSGNNEKSGSAKAGTPAPPSPGAGNKEAIVAECVEQVLEILKNKSER
ncbi:DUF5908 family protein [Chlorobium sp.]|uniref:DUF5908 family protein n=1 Tax=Chlorobium sp. TaxID=1095 RepID=UPI002F42E5A9